MPSFAPHNFRLFLAAFALLAGLAGVAYSQDGRSGIPAVDSLPEHEWDIPTTHGSLPLTLALSALFPGGGQFYTGHYVRGGFLLALEGGLAYVVFVNKPLQQQKRLEAGFRFRDSVLVYTRALMQNPGDTASQRLRGHYAQELRNINDKKLTEEDLRNSELAWLAGLHIYGILDAYGIWRNNQGHNTDTHSPFSAAWRAALIPGWGQIYNHEWGKAGLLYLGITGSVASLVSRQRMVRYYSKRERAAELEGDAERLSKVTEDKLFFRRKRNQYIWALALFYLYSIGDAAVDAILHDFDSPVYWIAGPQAGGARMEFGFSF
jgi:hypothetical protein